MTAFSVIIPARFSSTRLPGKPLLEIGSKPLIQHVYEAACKSRAKSIYIATDDEGIERHAQSFGAAVVMTSKQHESGTDRLAEASEILQLKDDEIIVNLQGDEFGMSPEVINQAADALSINTECNMATIIEVIENADDVFDPNIVKVVMDEHNFALYFSRAPIPWDRESNGTLENNLHEKPYYRHIGLYAYRKAFLTRFTSMPRSPLERVESLEQLRALHHQEKIHVSIATHSTGMGIDTPEDLEKAKLQLSS